MNLLQDDYSITLDAFKGPLDLLLFLIRRAEVEITDIPIAELTDQYLDFLGRIDAIDIDLAGEFLVMAATLVEIKSRVLQQRRERKQGEQNGGDATSIDETAELDLDRSDPRYELIKQLLAYQKYRIAAEDLERRREEFANRYPAHPARYGLLLSRSGGSPDSETTPSGVAHDDGMGAPGVPAGNALETPGVPPGSLDPAESLDLDIEDAHIFDLFEAYERIVSSVDFSRLGEHEVQDDDTPIGLHQEDLVDRMQRAAGRRITLQEAWLGRRKVDIIGLFLATLELVRQRRITVVQDEINGEIMLQLNEDPQQTGDSGDASPTASTV